MTKVVLIREFETSSDAECRFLPLKKTEQFGLESLLKRLCQLAQCRSHEDIGEDQTNKPHFKALDAVVQRHVEGDGL